MRLSIVLAAKSQPFTLISERVNPHKVVEIANG